MKNKILVVDDDEDLLGVVCKLLAREGFEVLCATNVEEALELFQNGWPFLVIADLNLQNHIDGSLMSARLHRSDPLCIFVAISGDIDPFKVGYMLGSVFTDILPKPFDLNLLVRIAKYAQEKRARWDDLLRGKI